MIPGPFEYHRPQSISEAVALLASLGDDAYPLAGGHSIIPLMKTRLAVPDHLVDLGGLADLKFIRREMDHVVVGAMTTQQDLIVSAMLKDLIPLVGEAAATIADPQIRAMGTLGGNVANGDPGNDMPALMQCLGADYLLTGPDGDRSVAARDFYHDAYDTARLPGEIVTAIRIPIPPAGHGSAYEKLKRKVGDYATAAAAVVLTLEGGVCKTCSIGLTNVASTPLWALDAATALIGTTLDKAALEKAIEAAEAITSPAHDSRGPVEYRTKMAGVMVRRAVERAHARAAA
ncbi:xanthine dehydrogenase family protein subunit M [Lichenihabitans sp. PAMC28606]|uniref:FAD binding domain-containing protein n=1 Tax=Lichenihabitans sp. PAMC28606 TaxID=2880932 RepID=UPI001D0B1CD0|nr:xanthine dehydrogenase family protein subunit M [Lichenihabitans sp. PAMC28606]UDL96732.1 xanthine dehydrogenase family protein subunit M [Lichenihabitans sp. PAMC28606]